MIYHNKYKYKYKYKYNILLHHSNFLAPICVNDRDCWVLDETQTPNLVRVIQNEDF